MSSEPDNTDETQNYTVTVTNEDREEYKRLDVYLAQKLPQFSRSTLRRLFDDEEISSDVKLSINKMPPAGTVIEVEIPPPVPTDLIAENIPLDILFEDKHLIIINKPAGLVVHPAPGHYTGTLVNAILYHCPDLKGIGAEKRPGIVHRLDMGTSGVMVVAKDQATHEGLVSLFSIHDIDRKYEALVGGQPAQQGGTITTTIGRHPTHRQKMAANVKNGKTAVTHYKVLKQYKGAAHMELRLQTGRTHQIRVHMSQMLHTPVLCDPIYGGSDSHLKRTPDSIRQRLIDYPYQLLHAKELGFVHPITKEKLHFTAPPPEIFQAALKAFSE
ncbi:RluA family pseudouridine synthase [Peredibacter starrii]|uniref:Pseudouridine synthase n=1 Tax=Peredibacter starrii TaxID=28202 RepID=A0AAX4HNX6_9BACT|nr:RluA family pseudouridine synthase [Peredibacter starrii]WPU64875.1 RluA family pseudouridine synthase [Peredibacter starrii]